jgi:hypothetical protein
MPWVSWRTSFNAPGVTLEAPVLSGRDPPTSIIKARPPAPRLFRCEHKSKQLDFGATIRRLKDQLGATGSILPAFPAKKILMGAKGDGYGARQLAPAVTRRLMR